jgi:hypothetical protein
MRVTITDTLGFWHDYLETYVFNPEHAKTLTGWYRLPQAWLRDGVLLPEREAALLAYRYGTSWRLGNGDGSQYVVLKIEQHELVETEVAQRPWEGTRDACYVVDEQGAVSRVEAREL